MSLSRPFRRRRSAEPDLTEFMRPEPGDPAEPDPTTEPVWAAPELVEPPGAQRWGWFRRHRPGSVGVFALAFLFMLGAAVSVAFAHFTASRLAPWLSMSLSAVAVICTVLALVTDRDR